MPMAAMNHLASGVPAATRLQALRSHERSGDLRPERGSECTRPWQRRNHLREQRNARPLGAGSAGSPFNGQLYATAIFWLCRYGQRFGSQGRSVLIVTPPIALPTAIQALGGPQEILGTFSKSLQGGRCGGHAGVSTAITFVARHPAQVYGWKLWQPSPNHISGHTTVGTQVPF